MNYSKKDEDADGSAVKVDRTSVFQEGVLALTSSTTRHLPSVTDTASPGVQYVPNCASTVPDPTHQDFSLAIHGREVPHQRSDVALLRHLEAVSEQRCQSPADGLPGHQRARSDGRGCHHGHQQYHERHDRWQRRSLPRKCHSKPLSNH